jgi:hypothetical protein
MGVDWNLNPPPSRGENLYSIRAPSDVPTNKQSPTGNDDQEELLKRETCRKKEAKEQEE